MTHISTIEYGAIVVILRDLGWLAAGVLAGLGYFIALRSNVRLLTSGQLLVPLGLQLLRFGLLAVALAFVARSFGALPLLLTTGGLLIARAVVIRWEARRD